MLVGRLAPSAYLQVFHRSHWIASKRKQSGSSEARGELWGEGANFFSVDPSHNTLCTLIHPSIQSSLPQNM